MELNIFCDGGSRGNPGPAACAYVVKDSEGNLREKRGKYLGVATNNIAEYQAVIEALSWLTTTNHELSAVNFFLDSQLVVSQINGFFKVKNPNLRELLVKIRELENTLTTHFPLLTVHYSSIPRSQNYLADALVNTTLDHGLALGQKIDSTF